jgi:hypothetical protein
MKGAHMSKQETDKIKAEQTIQINLEDLPVDEAHQDEINGGSRTPIKTFACPSDATYGH